MTESSLNENQANQAHNERLALGALLAVQLLFGMLPVMGKLAFPAFGAGGVAVFRIAGGVVVFGAIRALRGLQRVAWADQRELLLCAILGIAGNQLLYLYGLSRTSAIHATLIITLIPALTHGMAVLHRVETTSLRRIGGIVLGFGGVAVLLSDAHAGAGGLVGNLLILLNCTLYAIYLVRSRALLQRYPPISVLAGMFAWSLPITLLVAGLPSLAAADTRSSLAVLYIVAGPTIASYYLNLYALRVLPPTVVAIFVHLQPFITALLAVPLLGEELTSRTIAAAFLTFAGVWWTTR